jgi:TRAP-type uncharacterized transport system fused permease subunit
VFGIFGLYAFVAVMEGYLEDKLTLLNRGLLLLATFAMLWPNLHIGFQLAGLVVFLIIFRSGMRSFNLTKSLDNKNTQTA